MSEKGIPLVSFIIPTYRQGHYLERALKAIIEERSKYYSNIEIIVVDGGSDDNTIDILHKYEKQLSYWISEADNGPAEAFNKGINRSTGQLIRYISSDDELILGSTNVFVNYLCNHPELDVLSGLSNFYYEQNSEIKHIRTHQLLGEISFKHLAFWGAYGGLSPECCFFRREVFDSVGFWRVKYRFACDLDYWFLLVRARKRIYVLPQVILNRFIHEKSITVASSNRVFSDTYRTIKDHAGNFYAAHYALRYKLFPNFRKYVEVPFKLLELHPRRWFDKVKEQVF